jgi:hypothetical protein
MRKAEIRKGRSFLQEATKGTEGERKTETLKLGNAEGGGTNYHKR